METYSFYIINLHFILFYFCYCNERQNVVLLEHNRKGLICVIRKIFHKLTLSIFEIN